MCSILCDNFLWAKWIDFPWLHRRLCRTWRWWPASIRLHNHAPVLDVFVRLPCVEFVGETTPVDEVLAVVCVSSGVDDGLRDVGAHVVIIQMESFDVVGGPHKSDGLVGNEHAGDAVSTFCDVGHTDGSIPRFVQLGNGTDCFLARARANSDQVSNYHRWLVGSLTRLVGVAISGVMKAASCALLVMLWVSAAKRITSSRSAPLVYLSGSCPMSFYRRESGGVEWRENRPAEKQLPRSVLARLFSE